MAAMTELAKGLIRAVVRSLASAYAEPTTVHFQNGGVL